MKRQAMSEEETRAMLEEAFERIQQGGLKAISIKAMTTTGEELEHTFPLETEDERTFALHALAKVLGKVH